MAMAYGSEPITKTPQEYCAEIADFLSANRDAWTQGAAARDAYGHACDSEMVIARRWCAIGLIEKFVQWPHIANRCVHLLKRAITPLNWRARSPAAYNDTSGRTVDDVIRMFRCASFMPTLPEDQMIPPTATTSWVPDVITEDQPLPDELPPVLYQTLDAAITSVANFYAMNAAEAPPPEPVIKIPNWSEMILKGSFCGVPQDVLPLLGKERLSA